MKRYWVLVGMDGAVKDVMERAFAPLTDMSPMIHWGRGRWFDAVDLNAENEEDAKRKALAAIAQEDREP